MRGDAVVVLIPVLRRPHRVAPLLESLCATGDFRPLFIASPGDHAEHKAVTAAGADLLVLDREHGKGDYARKINAGYRASTEPLLFLAADDLHFHPNWLENALDRVKGRVQVVGTNDLGNPRTMRGVHSTHTLVERSYVDANGTIDEPKTVLHEGYWHEYCDDEFIETARYRDALDFATDSIVEHLHPSWGKAPMDDLYANEAKRMRQGYHLFHRRRPLWT